MKKERTEEELKKLNKRIANAIQIFIIAIEILIIYRLLK